MRRAIQSECDGEFANSDGTWRLPSRVPGVPNCLYTIMGEDGKVHDYAVLRSESKKEVEPFVVRCVALEFRVGETVATSWTAA